MLPENPATVHNRSQTMWRPTPLMTVVIVVLITTALFFRFFMLHRMPGINGDEACGVLFLRNILAAKSFDLPKLNGHYPSLLWSAAHAFWLVIFPDSFATLRLPVALWSTILFFVCSWLLYRTLGLRRALTAALFMACLPVTIGFSRISWEMALVVPSSAITLALAWSGRVKAAIISLAVGLLIHPVMVFVLASVIPLVTFHTLTQKGWSRRRRFLTLGGSLGAATVAIGLMLATLPDVYSQIGPMFQRLAHGEEIAQYLFLFNQLFSGITIYSDFSGTPSVDLIAVHDWLFGGFFVVATTLGTLLFVIRRRQRELCLVGGFLLIVCGFYFAGSYAHLVAGYERHGLPLVFPTLLLLVCALDEIAAWLRRPSMTIWVSSAACAAWLLSFGFCYFGEFFHSGGNAVKIYRTASIEPKSAAFTWIADEWTERRSPSALKSSLDSAPGEIIVITEDWWNQWPLKFLASRRKDLPLRVIPLEEVGTVQRLSELMTQGAYAQGFADEFLFGVARDRVPAGRLVDHTVLDASGRPLIYIWRLKGPL